MPIKELRGEQDIGEMAEELSRRWRQGDGVKPFLRSLEPELSRKVREERWSWESIAHALNRAGIRYRTGRPWTGVALLSKMTSIRHEAKRVHRRSSASPLPHEAAQGGNRALAGDRPEASVTRAEVNVGHDQREAAREPIVESEEDDEPEFRPATLANWSGTMAQPTPAKPPATVKPEEVPAEQVADMMARLLGKKR